MRRAVSFSASIMRGMLASSVCVNVPLAPSAAVTFPMVSKMGRRGTARLTIFFIIHGVSRLLDVL